MYINVNERILQDFFSRSIKVNHKKISSKFFSKIIFKALAIFVELLDEFETEIENFLQLPITAECLFMSSLESMKKTHITVSNFVAVGSLHFCNTGYISGNRKSLELSRTDNY